ncbi:uncharacterized protein RJT20DRAFT_3434 [Scheffersomyces xylosifermentans]|uniref:uncharacterized protein n=1 Tax=Scheffersomyces xylosifermentans TaxID=1304137 RepID=UPI00315DBA24
MINTTNTNNNTNITNNISIMDPSRPSTISPTNDLLLKRPSKRDRPLSSCLDMQNDDYVSIESELASPCTMNGGTSSSVPTTSEIYSPLFNRKPFKNLSNLVLPNMKKKLTSSTKSFTRSMTAVTKSSHSFFSSGTSNTNDENSMSTTTITNNTNDPNFMSSVASGIPMASSSSGLGIRLAHDDADDSEDDDMPHSPTQKRNAMKSSSDSRNSQAIRRIHSMCQTTKEKESYHMEDNSHLKNTSIRTFTVKNELLPRIDEHEMDKIISGEYKDEFDEIVVVDCRFKYEYDGGHILDAKNISTKKDLETEFLSGLHKDGPNEKEKRRLVIFHCEFSVFRGPTMASHLRKVDRRIHIDSYPYLKYPDIVVLEGGYKEFFRKYSKHCFPRGYVEMKDVNHEKNCESEMHRVRQESKLTRAKSYNQFGSDDLPIAPYNHNRSRSYTTITSEKILKRQRSDTGVKTLSVSSVGSGLKLARASTFSYDQSIFAHNSSSESIVWSPSNNASANSSQTTVFDQEFQPPSTSFRSGHMKSLSSNGNLSSSSVSINSSISSICSDGTFSSTESLSDSFSSPMGELSDFFEPKSSNLTNYMRNMTTGPSNNGFSNSTALSANVFKPVTRKPSAPVPVLPNRTPSMSSISNTSSNLAGAATSNIIHHNSHNAPHSTFKFPNNIKSKGSRHNLNRLNTSGNSSSNKTMISTPSLLHSSPIISSPLSTATPVSTLDSGVHHSSSIIDPINDTPVDFTVPFFPKPNIRHTNHVRKRSGSLLSSAGGGLYNFMSLDIDEADEEQDDGFYSHNSSTLKYGGKDNSNSTLPTPAVSAFSQKSPFN